MAAILSNPRYTGRQVWNRQRVDHHDDPALPVGASQVQRWNPSQHWILSRQPAHPALISEAEFVTAQTINATPLPHTGQDATDGENATRTYLLTGLVRCGDCGRRLQAHWLHGRAGYRCRHGHTSAKPQPDRLPNLYLREDHAIARITEALHENRPDQVPADPWKLAEHLRRAGIIIEIDRKTGTVTLDQPPATLFSLPIAASRPDHSPTRRHRTAA